MSHCIKMGSKYINASLKMKKDKDKRDQLIEKALDMFDLRIKYFKRRHML